MIRWALASSLLAFLLGLLGMIGFLLTILVPRGEVGGGLLLGTLPGILCSFVALTLSAYPLPDQFLLRRGLMFLSLGLNGFPWVFLLGFVMTVGLGPGD